MKRLSASMLAIILGALPMVGFPDDNTVLQNLQGTVTYGPAAASGTEVASHSQVSLSEGDRAATGERSLAAIALPDGSKMLMGSNTAVQIVAFDTSAALVTANFLVIGKVRFHVQHATGAKTTYRFETSTGQISVHGALGDIIATASGGLHVAVYSLSDPALPVQVNLVNGRAFMLAAGQTLEVTAVAGAIQTVTIHPHKT